MKIEKNCLECDELFFTEAREVNRGNGKFCSIKCSNIYKGKIPKESNVTCAFCKKDFYKNKSKQSKSKSGLHFCTRACKDKAQRIGGIKDIQPNHYGEVLSKYRDAAFRSYEHKCAICSYSKYKEVLEVHHKDEDRTNNKISNLIILCPTCHKEVHYIK